MKSVKEVYEEFVARRRAILKALTTDVEKFYAQCDPEKDNLCLYGNVDGNWEVNLPCEEVPPEIPEPALGINFARDGMQKRDFLALVAVHSDSWLLGLAFYKGARLSKEQRQELFHLINELPTCYEVVSGRSKLPSNGAASAHYALGAGGPRPQMQHPQMQHALAMQQQQHAHQATAQNPRKRRHVADEDDDDEEDGDGWQDGDGDPCPDCGKLYRVDEFWIACDQCEAWYCGKCAKMTEAKAQRQKTWKCNSCLDQHG